MLMIVNIWLPLIPAASFLQLMLLRPEAYLVD